MSKKVEQILAIWASGLGIVSLHCFQSVIPVEAYTREASMVDAIGMNKFITSLISKFNISEVLSLDE